MWGLYVRLLVKGGAIVQLGHIYKCRLCGYVSHSLHDMYRHFREKHATALDILSRCIRRHRSDRGYTSPQVYEECSRVISKILQAADSNKCEVQKMLTVEKQQRQRKTISWIGILAERFIQAVKLLEGIDLEQDLDFIACMFLDYLNYLYQKRRIDKLCLSEAVETIKKLVGKT